VGGGAWRAPAVPGCVLAVALLHERHQGGGHRPAHLPNKDRGPGMVSDRGGTREAAIAQQHTCGRMETSGVRYALSAATSARKRKHKPPLADVHSTGRDGGDHSTSGFGGDQRASHHWPMVTPQAAASRHSDTVVAHATAAIIIASSQHKPPCTASGPLACDPLARGSLHRPGTALPTVTTGITTLATTPRPPGSARATAAGQRSRATRRRTHEKCRRQAWRCGPGKGACG
jgi:hypothetical protein